MRRTEHRWGLVAVTASASLHVAFAAYIAARPVAVPPPKTIDVEFVFEAPPEQPKTPVEEPPPPPPAPLAVVKPPPPRPPQKTEPPPPRAKEVPRTDDRPLETDRPTRSDVPVDDAPRADVPRLNTTLLPSNTVVLTVDAGTPGSDV